MRICVHVYLCCCTTTTCPVNSCCGIARIYKCVRPVEPDSVGGGVLSVLHLSTVRGCKHAALQHWFIIGLKDMF